MLNSAVAILVRDSPDFKICQLRLMATSGGTEKVVFTGHCNDTHRLYRSDELIKKQNSGKTSFCNILNIHYQINRGLTFRVPDEEYSIVVTEVLS